MTEPLLANKLKGVAVISLVLGPCGLPTLGLLGIGSIVGLVLVVGLIALKRIRVHPSRYAGKGFAIAGLTTNAISLLIAGAIIMPGPLMARVAMNETSAVSSLRSIRDAEADFRARSRHYGRLDELAAAGLLPSDLASGSKNRYLLEILTEADSFEAFATPSVYRHHRWALKKKRHWAEVVLC
jgi:hypothetical protein